MKRSSFGYTSCLVAVGFGLLVAGCAQKPPSFKEQVKDALDLYYAGEKARKTGNLEAAVSAYRRSLSISPRPIVHLHLAHVLIDLDRFDEARRHLDIALKNNPEYAQVHNEQERLQAKVTVAQRTGATPSEPKPLEPFPATLVKPGPPSPTTATASQPTPSPKPSLSPEQQAQLDTLLEQARQALAQKKTEDAIAAYKSCLEIAPNRGELHYYLANAYLSGGDLERAHLEYRQALQLNPNLPGAFNNLGIVYERMGQTEEAIQAYREAIRVGDHTDSYYNLAVVLEKRGKWKEALKMYRVYLERDSSSQWADSARRQVRSLERALY